jgi:phospholipase A1
VESDAARLACYDAAVHRTAPAKSADAAPTPAVAAPSSTASDVAAQPADSLRARIGQAVRAHRDDLFTHEPTPDPNAAQGSLLDSRWELAPNSKLGTFNLRGYKPVYLLPAFWTSRSNPLPSSPNPLNTVTTPQQLQAIEAKFQLSFKTKIAQDLFGANGDLWTAYTQSSHWQVYNGSNSRPFRETNYEPEVMLVFRSGDWQVAGWHARMYGIGLNHQSNGRADPLSRSWNRVVASVGFDREHWSLVLRPWWRIPETFRNDNNPDIADYVGRGDATLVYHAGEQEVSILGRHTLRGGARSRGAVQVDWSFPIQRGLHGYVQLFHGYGESLIDYNHEATYVGLGISLLDWY